MEENGTHERSTAVAMRASPRDRLLDQELVALLPRLRRFARALTGSAPDADDVVQIALERALARSTQLRADAPLASWMFGIVRNAWIDELRARGRRARLPAIPRGTAWGTTVARISPARWRMAGSDNRN